MNYIGKLINFYKGLHIVDKVCSIITLIMLSFVIFYFEEVEILLFYYVWGVGLSAFFPYICIILLLLIARTIFRFFISRW